MTQHLFAAETAPSEVNLDANFTELYNATITYSFKAASPVDDNPNVFGVNLFSLAAANSYRPGIGFNVSHDGTNWRTAPDGGAANGGAAILCRYGSGTIEFHCIPATGAAGQTIADSSMVAKMSLFTAGLMPGADNTITLGNSSNRWATVYAATGSINTSDEREKTAIVALSTAEIAAAQDLVANIGTYQWLAAIQAKSEGDARKHIGMTVQQAIATMTAHGLDPMAYGFICYDAWPEEKDSAGNVTRVAGDRYSFRPDELGMFIARGVAARLTAIETRLHALDGL